MTEMPTLVYLAEPIDQIPADAGPTVADDHLTEGLELRHRLREGGFNLFKARSGWEAKHADPRIDRLNRQVLYQADCLVAWLPEGIPSIGVPAEIEAATARGIPAVVLHTKMSNALAANSLVTVIDHPSSVVDVVEHVVRIHPRPAAASIQLVIRDGMVLPQRAYDDDAGIDLNTAIGVTLNPGEYADVRTQVDGCELPPNCWGFITGRSSTIRKRGIHVPNGVIDPGWRGPLYVGAHNLTNEPVHIKVGDRLGQLILIPSVAAHAIQVASVGDHPRGLNGFGSSGD